MGIQSNQQTHACIHNIKSPETCNLTRGTHTHHSQSLGDFIEHKLSSESHEEQPPEQRNRSVQHQLAQNVRTKPSRKKKKFGFLPQPSKKRKLGTGNRYTLSPARAKMNHSPVGTGATGRPPLYRRLTWGTCRRSSRGRPLLNRGQEATAW
jgi:hypothetical protein